MKQVIAIFSLTLLILGCSHPLEIAGDGDITSATGNRDCLQADFLANQPNCAENYVVGPYNETYYGDPQIGSHFHRWANCPSPAGNECSFAIPGDIINANWGETAPPLIAIFRPDVNTGFKSVLMGHSFFNPWAIELAVTAPAAGFTNHTQNRYFQGGGLGAPQAFWVNSFYKSEIQGVLNSGDVDLLGMTFHTSYPGILGYRNWTNYALAQNPDTRIFIHMPWFPYPASIDAALFESATEAVHQNSHNFIDTLRGENPGVDFFCIPMGQAAAELRNLFVAGNLPDISNLTGGAGSSLFTDSLGHPGNILKDLGHLVWLYAIYDVDPMSMPADPGYTTDLRVIAKNVVDNHDANYNFY